ncbi:MAG: hypothetical protein ABIH37_00430 [archaeon]
MNENEIFEELNELNFESKIKISKEAVDYLLKALNDYIYGYKFKDYDEEYRKDAVEIFISDILKSVRIVNEVKVDLTGHPHCLNCGNPLVRTGYFQTHAKNLCYLSLFCFNCKKSFKYYSEGGKRLFEIPSADFDSKQG